MKVQELKGKSPDELSSLLLDFKKEAMNLRFQRTTGELENTARVRVVRRSIARIKTLQQMIGAGVIAMPAPKKKAVKKVAKPAKEETKAKVAAPKEKKEGAKKAKAETKKARKTAKKTEE